MASEAIKARQLKTLEKEIKSQIPGAWLFPQIGNVKGFMGTGDVMFVGERPSKGSINSPPVTALYRFLEEDGMIEAHLTDLIKARSRVNDPYPANMDEHRRFFDRELDIIRPSLVVAFGEKVYHLLLFTLAGTGISVCQTWHYAYLRWPGKEQKFRDKIEMALTSSGYRIPRDARQAMVLGAACTRRREGK